MKRVFSCENDDLSSRKSSGHVAFYFDNPAKIYQKFHFSPSAGKRWYKCFFQKVCFSSKNSFRKLECSFDNPVKSFLPNERKYLSRPQQKLPKLNVFQKCIPRKKFHWPRGMLLQQTALSFPARHPIMLGSSLTKILQKQVSQKN